MGIIVCLFVVFTCRQISLITESWHGIIKYRYNNYHEAFRKQSLSCYLKIWVFPLWACLVRQLRPRNLVSVEANCQLIVQRLTPQLCSQVCRVFLLLHPVLLECPHLSSERRKETKVLTEQAFRQLGELRVAWEKTRWVLEYELHCKHLRRPSILNWRKRWELWKRKTDKFETSVSETGGQAWSSLKAYLNASSVRPQFPWQRV